MRIKAPPTNPPRHVGLLLLEEARRALGALRDRRLALLLGLFGALLLLAAQAPLAYTVDVGVEDGPGSDLPLVAGFHPREEDIQGSFRWTKDVSLIRLPGLGVRPVQLALRFIAVSPEVAERGPRELELWANGALAVRLPVRPQGVVHRVALPPAPTGDYLIELRSATIVPTGDERAIGAGLASFVASVPGGPAPPAWGSTVMWLAAVLLGWLAVRRAGFGAGAALAMLLPVALLAALAALLDPPRFAFGAAPALVALALGWLLAVALGLVHPSAARLCGRLGIPLAPTHWRWLALMAVVVLATRYGGKIYPDSMPGDIGFHVNRFADVARGTVLIVSRNRGVDFPYPPALYLILAPFTLLGLDRRTALQLGGALLDAASPLLVYVVAAGIAARARSAVSALRSPRSSAFSTPLAAAALYSFSAATLMTTWWNFSTHIFAQLAHLLLVAALVVLWPVLAGRRATAGGRRQATGDGRWATGDGRRSWPLVLGRRPLAVRPWPAVTILVLLQSLVYLGHFGFWMNMSLLGGIGLAALLWAAWRGLAPWGAFRLLLAAFVAAQAVALLLFYSGYTGLLLAQAQATASGGLTGLAGRAPVSRATLWTILWDYGLRTHFGFFPIPLALCGALLLALRGEAGGGRRGIVLALMAGTFAIAGFFAVLPFLSGSTLSSRWLMFSAWVVAVGAALAHEWLWRRGWAGRLVVLAASGYTLWITASMWLTALAWRMRPPEPF
ncbi:MAG: hypothetical protein RLZZ387_5106 [Chloroflexota bacterium]|jgi:hypothetical protein